MIYVQHMTYSYKRNIPVLQDITITEREPVLYYGGVLDSWFRWIWLNIKPMTAFISLGIIGLVALFSTYPLMRNAPLQPNLGKN